MAEPLGPSDPVTRKDVNMRNFCKNIVSDCRGATAIEYGLIAAFISLAMVAALPTIKANLGSTFGDVGTELAA
jgi:pilus assembly protein Flp/PilA